MKLISTISNSIHRNEDGSVAFKATLRYLVALVAPDLTPGFVSGRALTPEERRLEAQDIYAVGYANRIKWAIGGLPGLDAFVNDEGRVELYSPPLQRFTDNYLAR